MAAVSKNRVCSGEWGRRGGGCEQGERKMSYINVHEASTDESL